MTTVSLGEAKDKLSALVESAASTHDIITITRHGQPAAALISIDDLESLRETVYWLSQQSTGSVIAEAENTIEAGETVSGDDLRAEFGLPPQ